MTTYTANGLNQYYRADAAGPGAPSRQHLTWDADGNLSTVYLVGDMNCDGQMNNFDLDPFVLALTNRTAWEAAHPGCDWLCTNDINQDGQVNMFDIDPFVECLTRDGPGRDAPPSGAFTLHGRPMVSERISDYIDDRLLWLAARSDRLTTDQHWRLWAQAVTELRPARISERFKSYLQAILKTKDLPEPRRSAIESLHFLTPDQDQIGKAAKPEP